MANDKSFQDPTNLENKLQRHQEFVAEVNANEQRIQNIAKVSLKLQYIQLTSQFVVYFKCLKYWHVEKVICGVKILAMGVCRNHLG